ncbi:ABC transporter substrate-binding protein [Desulfotomaculum copahuensis]|uniref:Fe/B12 periplasmic-binding domain-containing protein n=1 Tax=Desulfotomaculum copahuensis TaxID=1838280 RepID=A0A1B7LB39_9FIRM|nr:helical backbone metal receptor [Desulfotomaculum copahuensis]OAT79549.1 hypothetical protein A6M21_15630 [Desulfotomaculum copahuensis]
MRIVSLVPAHTEILFTLGLGEQVVGVTGHCDFPPAVADKPRVGHFARPEPTEIIALKPDLVLAGGPVHRQVTAELREAGVNVFEFSPSTVEQLLDGMKEIAGLAGTESTGRQVVAALRARVDAVKAKTSGKDRPAVLFLMGGDPLTTPGPGSCQYDALYTAGAGMMTVAAGEPFAFIDWEDVVNYDPEIILACGHTPGQPRRKRCPGCKLEKPPCHRNVEELYDYPQLASVRAVKAHHVYPMPCHYVCRPGPRMVEGMEKLSELINS